MCTPRNSFRVVMFGLPNSGKTTISSQFTKCKKSEFIRIPPNVQHFDWGPLRVTSIDVGPTQPDRRNVFNGAKAVIFVVDSSDYKNFEEAKNRFWCVARNPRVRRAVVLIFANKSDCPGALLPKQIEEKWGLQCLGGKWKVVPTNAKTGEGVCEGLAWVKAKMCPTKKSCIELISEFLILIGSSSKE